MKKLVLSLLIFSSLISVIRAQPSMTTDYYRSFQTGNWNSMSTWESSHDNITWFAATLVPTSAADTILIRNGHTVTIDPIGATAEKLVVQSGGTLVHPNGNVFALTDGPGIDMTVASGGIYVINGTQLVSASITDTIDIQSGGLVRVDGNSAPSESDDFGSNGNIGVVIYETGSTYQWNTTDNCQWSGQYFFTPGNNTNFTFSQTPSTSLGGNTNTTIYGTLIANADLVIAGPSGDKTITNGIKGTNKIDASSAGNIIFTSANSVLGGDTLKMNTSLGKRLKIGDAANSVPDTCTLISNKIIIGDVGFAFGNSYFILNDYNLTISSIIYGYGPNNFIKTNGNGYLKMNAIGSTRVFAIGDSTQNILYVNNGNNADYYAQVKEGITPPVGFPSWGVRRTWNIYASAVTTNVQLTFYFSSSDEDLQLSVRPPPPPLEVLEYTGGAWNIIPGNQNLIPIPTWYLISNSTITINNSSVPYALGLSGGYILPLDCIVSCQAHRNNNQGIINFQGSNCAAVENFEVQKLVNGNFQTIGTLPQIAGQTDYSFMDVNLQAGVNQYRIRAVGFSGSVKYSNTVILIYNSAGIVISSVYPNPAHTTATVTVSSAGKNELQFTIYSLAGEKIRQWQTGIGEGTNTISMDVSDLPAGLYLLQAATASGKSLIKFEKQ